MTMNQNRSHDLQEKCENPNEEVYTSLNSKERDIDIEAPTNAGRIKEESTVLMKVLSALAYFSCSFLITVVNKIVLTSYNFPSYQMLCSLQFITTIVALGLGKHYGMFRFPSIDRSTFGKIHPLPLIFFGNAVTGLGGTHLVSLPMHACLRRFAVLLTMIGEVYLLGVIPSRHVQIAVYTMMVGAIIAALKDLSFNFEGYSFVFLNNFLTAANGICIKKKLSGTHYGHYGLMYYCAVFMVVPQMILTCVLGDIQRSIAYDGWSDPLFLLNFFLSCILGVVLNVTMCLCTKHNSALTSMVVGTLKSIFVTYLGMFIGGDYHFEWTNFIGINISVAGSLLYTYVAFKPQEKRQQPALKL